MGPETKEITIILKDGNEKMYPNAYNIVAYAKTITFDVAWNSISQEGVIKKFVFKDYAGYSIA